MQNFKHPELKFFIARILIKLSTAIKRVRNYKINVKNKLMKFFFLKESPLQLGQCLPASCSITDIETILKLDVAAQHLVANGTGNEMSFMSVRPVPGDYEAWGDGRFHLFMYVLWLHFFIHFTNKIIFLQFNFSHCDCIGHYGHISGIKG